MGAAGGNRGMTDNSLSDIENFREPDNYIPKHKIYENNIKVQKNLNPKNNEIKKKKKNKKYKKKKNNNYNDDNYDDDYDDDYDYDYDDDEEEEEEYSDNDYYSDNDNNKSLNKKNPYKKKNNSQVKTFKKQYSRPFDSKDDDNFDNNYPNNMNYNYPNYHPIIYYPNKDYNNPNFDYINPNYSYNNDNNLNNLNYPNNNNLNYPINNNLIYPNNNNPNYPSYDNYPIYRSNIPNYPNHNINYYPNNYNAPNYPNNNSNYFYKKDNNPNYYNNTINDNNNINNNNPNYKYNNNPYNSFYYKYNTNNPNFNLDNDNLNYYKLKYNNNNNNNFNGSLEIISDLENSFSEENIEDVNYIPEKKVIKPIINKTLNYNCSQTIEKAHNEEITCIIYLSEKKEIVSSSLEPEIKVWSLKKNMGLISLKSKLKGHKNSVFYLNEFKEMKILCSCSADKTLKLWDIETLNCVSTLNEHLKSVLTCSFKYLKNNNLIFSGSDDKRILIWEEKKDKNNNKKKEKKNYEVKQILKGHVKSIITIIYIEKLYYLCSGSDDKTIRIWDEQNEFNCIKIINTLNSAIDNLRYSKNRILASCENGNIYFIHMSLLKQVRSVQLSRSAVYDFNIMDNEKYLIVASCDNFGRIWKIGTNHLTILKGHKLPLVSICQIDNFDIATASLDKSIKIWVKE